MTTYSDIAPLAGLDMGSQDDRNSIAEILGEISRHEYMLGYPMLSANELRANHVLRLSGYVLHGPLVLFHIHRYSD